MYEGVKSVSRLEREQREGEREKKKSLSHDCHHRFRSAITLFILPFAVQRRKDVYTHTRNAEQYNERERGRE